MNTHPYRFKSSHVRVAVSAAALLLGSPFCLAAAGPNSSHDAKAREMLERLISFETSEGKGQVPAMAEYLAGELRGELEGNDP